MSWTGTIGFIGAGNAVDAIVRGLVRGGVVPPQRCVVTNRSNDARLARLAREWSVVTTRDKVRLVDQADVVLVAVKPSAVPEVLSEIAGHVQPRHLVISIAAGIQIETIEAALGGAAVVRAMPNTSTAVGESATAICAGGYAGEAHMRVARAIFEAVGRVVEVPERFFDAVTGVSGSGPAYVYLLAEAMIEAAQREGLERGVAIELVSQTVLGAGRMLVETRDDPAVLRARVTSPGGTTMAAMEVFTEDGFLATVARAIARATRRAAELRALPPVRVR
ncbi:MAG TPA: pyrroline-5-carboxylate reductase [bacterium]|nr:pyrroline-5-carboxylate reductase [bacterium]